ncbi:MAG: hypothetical protein SFU53_08040 [Terrimicrobiaceae bacterium]|nr:hypothetical protein [Terrimicrobiaceae bacterium]
MTYSAADRPDTQIDFRQEVARGLRSQLVARQEPAKVERPRYMFRQRYVPIEGGRLLLRLTAFPQLEVDPATMEFEAVNWGVRLPCSKAEELPKMLARRFLDLFSKADAEMLSTEEEACWLKVLDQVDFTAFCIDRAAPHYLEGTLLQLEPICRVEWHDGVRQKLDGSVACTLQSLYPGDRFGAYVKLGRDNVVRFIERLVLLPSV